MRNTITRTIATVLAASALMLTSAGACGGAEGDDDDDSPGVNQQDGDGEVDD